MGDNPVAARRAWDALERCLGKVVTDRLRMGKGIDIRAANGFLYRIYPMSQPQLYNLTKKQRYCIHTRDISLPVADKVLALYEWIRLKPDQVEAVANRTELGDRRLLEELKNMDDGGGWGGIETGVENW